MDNNQKITYGILGILSLVIAAFGGSMLLTPDQLDHAYVCSVNENVGFFDRLSSTEKTGYYVNENNESKQSVCTNGKWIKLKDYAATKGVSIDSLLQKSNEQITITPQTIPYSSSGRYLCDQTKCEAIS